ncbi:MAG: hypothetical protein ACK4ZW_05795 [Blastomonas sp.]
MTQIVWLDDFVDEVTPCDCTLEGWLEWLSKPAPEWGRDTAATDGAVFNATVLELGEDIVVTRSASASDGWALSREPGDDEFVAVRHGQGFGWEAESIIERAVDFSGDDLRFTNSMAEALRAYLRDNDAHCGDTEYVAAGKMSSGHALIFYAMPEPHCSLVYPS